MPVYQENKRNCRIRRNILYCILDNMIYIYATLKNYEVYNRKTCNFDHIYICIRRDY